VAAGFSDSIIKLWSLRDRNVNTDKSGSGTNLVGHAGPVYGMDFSPEGDFLISCSQDKTARLWSTETKTNLVAYKGHNYPVFDVNFASQGLYFATASYDKTARLWSCDHIFPLRIFVGHMSDVTVH
jgi:transcription initiation factor TFIID subunit 5